MVSNCQSPPECVFCEGEVHLRYRGVFHPIKSDHGPFDIYACTECGSCQTHPLPSIDGLASLYNSFKDGLPDLHRTITADDPQVALYGLCVSRIRQLSGRHTHDKFTWLDVGAGGGEFAALMAHAFPQSHGIAVDQHSSPSLLAGIPTIDWHRVNVNEEGFTDRLPKVDLVVSISVWEHVLRPSRFAAQLLQARRAEGMLYLICPNNASWARRLLGQRWPYFTPGEHLAMPTIAGATRCLQREWRAAYGREGHSNVKISAKPLMLPYTLRYVSRRLGLDSLGLLLPRGWSLPLPAGALEATVVETKS